MPLSLHQQIGNSRVTRPRGSHGRLRSFFDRFLSARPSGTKCIKNSFLCQIWSDYYFNESDSHSRSVFVRSNPGFGVDSLRSKRLKSLGNSLNDTSEIYQVDTWHQLRTCPASLAAHSCFSLIDSPRAPLHIGASIQKNCHFRINNGATLPARFR